jgi:hypothetical protein
MPGFRKNENPLQRQFSGAGSPDRITKDFGTGKSPNSGFFRGTVFRKQIVSGVRLVLTAQFFAETWS